MFLRKTRLVRASALALGMNFVVSSVALSAPSDCPDTAIGGQTGRTYTKIGQSEVTEIKTFKVDGGACGLSAGTEVTHSETYNVGTYTDGSNTVRVNCSTGQVIK